jgi:hypothetical protein
MLAEQQPPLLNKLSLEQILFEHISLEQISLDQILLEQMPLTRHLTNHNKALDEWPI